MEWIEIPSGKFLMGSSEQDIKAVKDVCPSCDVRNEQPQHLVYLDVYKIGKYEVTNKQYSQCVKANMCNRPSNTAYDNLEFQNYPVTDINWKDALTFCEWNGGSLPSEAQWEKAARGSVTDPVKTVSYPWGSQWNSQNANVDRGENGTTMPIGSFSPRGDSIYGLSDMSGNVWEWIMDWYGNKYYELSPSSNPLGSNIGDYHLIRGGSFANSPIDARSAYRYYDYSGNTSKDIGVRCVK